MGASTPRSSDGENCRGDVLNDPIRINMKRLRLDFTERESKTLLEAFGSLDRHLQEIIQAAESEDKKTKVENNLLIARLLADQIKEEIRDCFVKIFLVNGCTEVNF